MPDHRIWTNDERTVLVTLWPEHQDEGDIVTVATREDSSATWGPPVYLTEEK